MATRPQPTVHRRARLQSRSSIRARRTFGLVLAAFILSLAAGTTWYRTVSAPALGLAAVQTEAARVAAGAAAPKVPTATRGPAAITATASLPTQAPAPAPTQVVSATPDLPILYYSQAGDTLAAIAIRFNVEASSVTSPDPIASEKYLNPGQLLMVPNRVSNTTSSTHIMPDSEVTFSPSGLDLNVEEFVNKAGGFLSRYTEYLGTTGTTSGAKIIERVAVEYSVNPRLLLALIEYRSHWVYSQPTNLAETDYPMGVVDIQQKGLYKQLTWAVGHLSEGYYGWREGKMVSLTFTDQVTRRLAPDLNAGSAAVAVLFANLYSSERWAGAVYGPDSYPALYEKMFGNPWLRSQTVEPLFPADLSQPELVLPFAPNQVWSFSGGPHAAFGAAGARAALDFAPGSTTSGCFTALQWVQAVATGLVVRSDHAVVVVDLDGDGHEQTGWNILYLHIATDGRVPVGTKVSVGDRIGHPSCEGGLATGTHVHIARKYNGEWMLAGGPIPFVLDGWSAHTGVEPYQGWLTRGTERVNACTCSSPDTYISRPPP